MAIYASHLCDILAILLLFLLLVLVHIGCVFLSLILQLARAVTSLGMKPFFVIDSGRAGQAGMRADCANWCVISSCIK